MPILVSLFLAFIVIPLVEIYLLIAVGSQIGALWTVTLVLATAVLGTGLLREQGLSTLGAIQLELSQGRLPAVAMVEGVLLLMTGVLLLTPGFATDLLGFLLLVPLLRRLLASWVVRKQLLKAGGVRSPFSAGPSIDPEIRPAAGSQSGPQYRPGSGPATGDDSRGPRTLDGDYEQLDD